MSNTIRPVIRLCFLLRQLRAGGAERQLLELLKGLDPSRYQIALVTFYDGGALCAELAGVPHLRHVSLGKRGRWDIGGFLFRLVRTVRRLRPQVLHGYLSVPNLLTVFLKPLFPRTRMVWGVRASDMDLGHYDRLAAIVFRTECLLSRFADRIIANSEAGRAYHAAHGFPPRKIVVVPNGIDTDRFRPDPAARRRVRTEWGVAENEILIGLVARLDPIKDHPTFLRAAAVLSRARDDVRFVCVGDGPARYREQLHDLACTLGLADRLIWAGARLDMPAVQNALDIGTCSSTSEGFPNAIGEAMACGVPCVAADVGDLAGVVGDTGIIVPPARPAALAEGWARCIERNRSQACRAARQRIEERFATRRLIATTAATLERLI